MLTKSNVKEFFKKKRLPGEYHKLISGPPHLGRHVDVGSNGGLLPIIRLEIVEQ